MTERSCIVGILLVAVLLQRGMAQAISVTVPELLAAPAKYNGKRIFVEGYYIGGFAESRLFTNFKSAANRQGRSNNIWIDQSIWANVAEVRQERGIVGVSSLEDLTKHTVRLIGTFRCHMSCEARSQKPGGYGFDWTGQSRYAITNVTYFRPSR
jgi:hypothetical protein